MNKIERIREIKARLESKLYGHIFTTVKERRLHFLGELEELLKGLKTRSLALNKGYKLLPLISEELESFHKIISERKDLNLADAYIDAVKKSTMDLPELVVTSQHENRFRKLENDSFGVQLGKFVKRMVRSAGSFGNGFSNFLRKSLDKPTKVYGSWTQNIPLQNLTEYHLCNSEAILKKWTDNDYKLQTLLLTELEKFLAMDFSDKRFCSNTEEGTVLFVEMLEELLHEINDARDGLQDELNKDFEAFKEELFYYLDRADTLERRKGFYDRQKVGKKSSRARLTLANYREEWDEIVLHLLDRTKIVNEFLGFQKELEEKSIEFLSSLDSFFNECLFEPIATFKEDLAGVHNKLQQQGKRQEKNAAANLLADSKDLLTKFVQQIRGNIREAVEGTELSLTANLYAEHTLLKANEISEHGLFVYNMELEKTPPVLNHRIIEWRLLLVRGLKEQIFNKLQPSKQHYEDFLVTIDAELEEVQQVIEINLESAIEQFRETDKDSNPFEIAIEALERTQAKLDASLEKIEDKQEALKVVVLEGGDEFCKKTIQLVHEGDSKELQILDAKYKVRETSQSWQTKAGARWARIYDSMALFTRFGWKKAKQFFTNTRRFLGLKPRVVHEHQKADVATYLSETDAKIKELPYIYRRLFDFEKEADPRFHVAINENFGYLSKAYESWEQGFPSTFAIVGEKGSGKSTYISFALNGQFSKQEVKKITLIGIYQSEVDFIEFMKEEFNLDGVDSLESIIEALNNSKKKKVFVLEALQNFYIRNINGYGALESLLYVISETKDTIFWIVSCSLYAWNFLDKSTSISQYFSHIIRTDTLNEQQMENVVMNRHRTSGYELIFEPGDAQSKSRAYRKLMDREKEAQAYLEKAYFKDLTELSAGNASIAMIFWIRSIKEFDDTHLYIKPLEVTSLEMIQELKPDVLFTLAAIVLHDTVTPAELSQILLFTEQESRLMLTRLKTRGLLRQNGERYVLNQLMYRQIIRVLKERNIIHLV